MLKRKGLTAPSLSLFAMMIGCQATDRPQWPNAEPPVAKDVPKELEAHGDVRVDKYYWMRERENPDVRAYLEAENRYTEAMLKPAEPLQEVLFDEFRERIKQDDTSAPYLDNGYYYYSRTEEGRQYPVYCRKKGSLEAPEEVILDVNELARGHEYTNVFNRKVTPDNKLLAYSLDHAGRRVYTIRFRDLATGKDLDEQLENVTGLMEWAADGKHLFYGKQDLQTLRWHQVWRHELGTDSARDVLIFEEKDDTYGCGVGKSTSDEYLAIISRQTVSTEVRFLKASDPKGEFRILQPRQRGLEYDAQPVEGFFYIRTNHQAKNFRLMRAPIDRPGIENWEEVIPHREDVYLDDIEVFKDYVVLEERKNGLMELRARKHDGSGDHYLDFGEPAYDASPSANYVFDTPLLRYRYTSLTTPDSVYLYDMGSREKTLVKEDEVLGGFDKANYTTERVWAEARDGAKVPVSLVYRNDKFAKDGTSPLLQYGYGSYGLSMSPAFNPYIISLLDRGFVYAIAHIRGGQEMGRPWYEAGKLLHKMNTFTDFIDVAEYLIENKYADPDRVFARGGSAGGLLLGAVLNLRPDLWRGVHAAVPFVDVVTTMLDDSIPLTTSEYDEWGNPNEKRFYDYMLSYSPYDQVAARDYPNILVTTAFEDSQVQYWEPAKWVAKLRAMKTDDNVILLKTEMAASHGGQSGRYDRYREMALQYAFIVWLAGIEK